MQHSITASCSPSYTAVSTASAVTSPPSFTPLAQPGSGTCGSVTSRWLPCERVDSSACSTTRTAISTSPSLRNAA